MGIHTVEKIGGTSMSRFGELIDNIFIGKRSGSTLYNRIFVVSAYGGITNLLLENKKTGEPGVYGSFAAGDPVWEDKLENVLREMVRINHGFADLGLDVKAADEFVRERMYGIRDGLRHLMQLWSFGHFQPHDYLPASREFLSAIGEAHSAHNSVLILQSHGVNARFVDLTGWRDHASYNLDEMISRNLAGFDYSSCMPIVTGYVKCSEGIMTKFDRGYSEITFSRIAVLTGAREGVIHKEFHLSTGDPKLIGTDKVRIIGNTNFDIADQLADMEMEAIHPKAAKQMEIKNIPIRVTNAFDPGNPGTLISKDYIAPQPRVDMICGRDDMIAVEIFDPAMVGQVGYDHKILEYFTKYRISYIAKNTNANTITHYVSERSHDLLACLAEFSRDVPGATVRTCKVAIVAVLGSNMKLPGFLSRAAGALAAEKINILALDQCMRQVNMQFMIAREDFEPAQIALHREFVEKEPAHKR